MKLHPWWTIQVSEYNVMDTNSTIFEIYICKRTFNHLSFSFLTIMLYLMMVYHKKNTVMITWGISMLPQGTTQVLHKAPNRVICFRNNF